MLQFEVSRQFGGIKMGAFKNCTLKFVVFFTLITGVFSQGFSSQIPASENAVLSFEFKEQIRLLAQGSLDLASQSFDYSYAFKNYMAAASYYEMIGFNKERIESLEKVKELAISNNSQEGEYLASALLEFTKGEIQNAKDFVLQLPENELAKYLLKQIEEVERIALKGRTFSAIFVVYSHWKDVVEKFSHGFFGKIANNFFDSDNVNTKAYKAIEKAFEKWGSLLSNPKYKYTFDIVNELEVDADQEIAKGMQIFNEKVYSNIVHRLIMSEMITDERRRSREILQITSTFLFKNNRCFTGPYLLTEMLKHDPYVGKQAKELQKTIKIDETYTMVTDIVADPINFVGGVGALLIARHISNLIKIKVFSNLINMGWRMKVAAEVFGLLIEVPIFIVGSAVWQTVFTSYKNIWSIENLSKSMGDAFLKFALMRILCAPLIPLRQSMGSIKLFAKAGAQARPDLILGRWIVDLNPIGNVVLGVIGNAGAVGGLMLGGMISEHVGILPKSDRDTLSRIIHEEIFFLQITLGTKGANALSGGRIEAAIGKPLVEAKMREFGNLAEAMGLKPKTQEYDFALRTLLGQHARGLLDGKQVEKLTEAGSPAESSLARNIYNDFFAQTNTPLGYRGKELWFGVEWQSTETQPLEPAYAVAETGAQSETVPSTQPVEPEQTTTHFARGNSHTHRNTSTTNNGQRNNRPQKNDRYLHVIKPKEERQKDLETLPFFNPRQEVRLEDDSAKIISFDQGRPVLDKLPEPLDGKASPSEGVTEVIIKNDQTGKHEIVRLDVNNNEIDRRPLYDRTFYDPTEVKSGDIVCIDANGEGVKRHWRVESVTDKVINLFVKYIFPKRTSPEKITKNNHQTPKKGKGHYKRKKKLEKERKAANNGKDPKQEEKKKVEEKEEEEEEPDIQAIVKTVPIKNLFRKPSKQVLEEEIDGTLQYYKEQKDEGRFIPSPEQPEVVDVLIRDNLEQALTEAQSFAMVPPLEEGGRPLAINKISRSSQGANWLAFNEYEWTKVGRTGYQNGEYSEILINPDGHPMTTGPQHSPWHAFPHVHALKGIEQIIIVYFLFD